MSARGWVRHRARVVARRVPPLSRLLDRQDQLGDANALLLRELEQLDRAPHRLMRHHQYRWGAQPVGDAATGSVATDDEDRALVERIIAAYGRSLDVDYYGDGSWWRGERSRHADIHEALVAEDVPAVTRILRNPAENFLLYGYEFAVGASPADDETWRQFHADRCKDQLVRLAEALGALPVENPEGGTWGANIELPSEDVISRVEKALTISLPIRVVQHGFHGVVVGDGVITERMIHAAYCAWRVAELLPDRRRSRVLEIGAGLGYTVHYADQFDIRDYTIVDLPMTNVAQAYFLGRTFGPDRVVLEGEAGAPDSVETIKIRTPAAMRDLQPFDLILNVDSLTEFGLAQASEYADRILELAPALLSINHEANAFTVADLFSSRGARIDRFPYWLRVGYVEEIIRPDSTR